MYAIISVCSGRSRAVAAATADAAGAPYIFFSPFLENFRSSLFSSLAQIIQGVKSDYGSSFFGG